jgi:G3E family GTPase
MKLALIGGFLGSGKTTAIVKACQLLMNQGKKVAVITNDQGDQQVDSELVKSLGISSREVSNGCFCCKYDQLRDHLWSLREGDRPDFVFAESVGSCTDLIATIVKPLYEEKSDLGIVASVFADAALLISVVEGRSSFLNDSVQYIYKKQLEEADLLIVNKTDLVTASQLSTIEQILHSDYPAKNIMFQNSFQDNDVLEWIGRLNSFDERGVRHSLQLDYDVYGEGEAQLAWLDKRISIQSTGGDAVLIAHKMIGSIFDEIQVQHFVIGHLKFFLEAGDWHEKISFTTSSTSSTVQNNYHRSDRVEMLINARVQTAPAELEKLVDRVLVRTESMYGCKLAIEKGSVFKPGYPRPTHRVD